MSTSTISKSGIKNYIYYGAGALVLFGLASSIATVNSLDVNSIFIFMLLVFLALGIIHLYTQPRFLPISSLGFNFLFTVIITLLGLVGILLFYRFYLTDVKDTLLAFGVLAFPLPFFVTLAFQLFLSIPDKAYKKWHYPINDEMPNLDLLDLTKVILVQFEFFKSRQDAQQTNFKAKAPYEMSFGQLFFIFINDYNERNPNSQIKVMDERNTIDGWLFFKKSTWWKPAQYIDPDLSFKQNFISDNDIIFCKRV